MERKQLAMGAGRGRRGVYRSVCLCAQSDNGLARSRWKYSQPVTAERGDNSSGNAQYGRELFQAMIRLAEESDFPRIIELGRKYLLEGPYKAQITDNPEAVERFTYWLFHQENGRILVFEEEGIQGVFAFMLYPHYYGGELCASELIWCVDKEHRGKGSLELLWAAERMAYDMGAVRMQLTAPTREIGLLYERCKGYSLVEVGYQAVLEGRVKHCPQ